MSTGIVVGASGGIGSACARQLVDHVNLLVLSGRRRNALQAVAAELTQRTAVVPADVATVEGRAAIVSAVEEPLAWVVLAHGLPLRRALAELTAAEIEDVYRANLVGPTVLLAELLRLEWSQPRAIVVVGSISATRSLPSRAVYGATKAGIEHLARSLAAELGPAGFRVNIVAAGVVETPFLGEAAERLEAWVQSRVPLQRLGTADEIAAVVRYLIADAPGYVTGARVSVDGGAEAVA